MPYKIAWVEPDKNLNLKVYPYLPDGYVERKELLFQQYRYATLRVDSTLESVHYCPECNGWVEGDCNKYEVNTLDGRRLSGRRGTDFHCARCGYKLGFFGMMS